ncbi:MAG: hypothetical protein JRH20_19200 [Deltaproteobacteria bacterium]|nr:hypothetical protein [Deltaproteobacteria bacterium]
MLEAGDWAVIALYMLVVAALGLWSARKQRTGRDYFLGGRQLSWWVVGLSIVATETSALTFIGLPALAFGALSLLPDGSFITHGGNLRFLQITLGYVFARVIVAMVMVHHYFEQDTYTPYQLLARRFGRPVHLMTSVFAIFNMCLQAGIRVYVTAIPVVIVLHSVLPGWGIGPSIVLLVLVAVIYAGVGGIRAVVFTDALQFFVFVAGGLFALFYIPTLVQAPDGSTGVAAIRQLAHDKLDWLHWGFVARSPGQGVGAWLVANVRELLGGDFNIWMGLIGATFGIMVSHGVDQLNVQRILACKDAREGRRALLFSAVIIAPLLAIFLGVGVALYAFYASQGFDFGGLNPWDPTAAVLVPKADYVFPIFIATEVPTLMRGLMVAGILAAALSSLTSALTAISSVVLVDIWPQDEGDSVTLSRARWGTLAVALVLAAVAWWAKDAALVFNLVFQFAGIFSGAKLGAVLLAMRAEGRYKDGAVLTGMVGSALTMTVIVLGSRAGWMCIHWPWYPAIGTLMCLGLAALVRYGMRR